MTGKEIIKDIMLFRKWSQSKLAEETGKSQTNITGYLNRGKNEMRLDVFAEMVEAMGCEVIVKDKMGTGKQWIVELKDNDLSEQSPGTKTSSLPAATEPPAKQSKRSNNHKIKLT